MAKAKAPWQIENERRAEVVNWHRAELPEDDEGLVEEFGACLERYHDAAIAGDETAMVNEALRMEAAISNVWHCPPGEKYGGDDRFDCWRSAASWLLDQTAAPDGEVPLYGQRGRFMLMVLGCRTDFHYDGLFGICGGSANVIDLDRPFYSDTGFRSFQVCPHGYVLHTGGIEPDDYLRRVCEKQLESQNLVRVSNGEMGRKPDTTTRHAWIKERRGEDPAWQPGGYLANLPSLTAAGVAIRQEKSGQFSLLF